MVESRFTNLAPVDDLYSIDLSGVLRIISLYFSYQILTQPYNPIFTFTESILERYLIMNATRNLMMGLRVNMTCKKLNHCEEPNPYVLQMSVMIIRIHVVVQSNLQEDKSVDLCMESD